MTRKIFGERGALFVEASIVFPVMFVIIFIMLFLGNAYYQQSRIEKIVTTAALDGASYCADPMLSAVEGSGSIPGLGEVQIQPYRYFLTGGMGDIESSIEGRIAEEIDVLGTGLFPGMTPELGTANATYHNGYIYSTFSVDLSGKIKMPIRLLFESEYLYKHVSYHIEFPVSDSTEFVRNVNMVEDFLEKYGVDEKIHSMIDKVVSWIPQND